MLEKRTGNASGWKLQLAPCAEKMESIGQACARASHTKSTRDSIYAQITHVVYFVKDGFADLNTVLQKHGELLRAAKAKSITTELIAEVDEGLETADLEYLTGEIPSAIEQSLEGVERGREDRPRHEGIFTSGTTEKTQMDLITPLKHTDGLPQRMAIRCE